LAEPEPRNSSTVNQVSLSQGVDTMVIERFFGKGRPEQAESKGKSGTRSRRSSKNSAEVEAPQTEASDTTSAEAEPPRIEATDAPAALVRTGEETGAEPTSQTPIDVVSVPPPSHEEIATRAYAIWMEQGRPEGKDQENWSEAERQLWAERTPL
jgi:Protein of unknown function (DUF2934)